MSKFSLFLSFESISTFTHREREVEVDGFYGLNSSSEHDNQYHK